MSALIKQTLRGFSLFVDGRGYAGLAEEVNPPKLTLKTSEWRGGGMDAPLEIETGMEKLECDFTVGEYNPDVLKSFGLTIGGVVPLTLRGSARNELGVPSAIAISLRGKIKELDFGGWKSGEQPKLKVMVALHYYRYEHNGEALIEIDVLNSIRLINGIDQLAVQRAALGI